MHGTIGIVILIGAWLAASVVAMTVATTTAVIVFFAVTIASFAVGRALLERHDH